MKSSSAPATVLLGGVCPRSAVPDGDNSAGELEFLGMVFDSSYTRMKRKPAQGKQGLDLLGLLRESAGTVCTISRPRAVMISRRCGGTLHAGLGHGGQRRSQHHCSSVSEPCLVDAGSELSYCDCVVDILFGRRPLQSAAGERRLECQCMDGRDGGACGLSRYLCRSNLQESKVGIGSAASALELLLSC